jgi:hypothetical protein
MGSPFTSARSGLWDASDVDTWGQGIGVYPQTAADVVTIAAGHTVTYNKSSTTELGAITVNGLLSFSTSMSTKLTLGHVDLTITNGGELRIGTNGAVLDDAYTAEIIWNTTSDNAKGLAVSDGGKLTLWGDPNLYGSDFDTVLVSNVVIPAATNAVTITVSGDFTSKWKAGQELIVHKGGSYGTTGYVNDFCRLAITGVAANGANTDIATTVTQRNAASLTCLAGADVLNVQRNIMLYKLSYNANMGQINTNRPRLTNATTAAAFGTNNTNISNASFGGFANQVLIGNNVYFDSGVIRNGAYGSNGVVNSQISNAIIMSCYANLGSAIHCTVTGNNHFIAAQAAQGILACINSTIIADVYGNVHGIYRSDYCTIVANIYANGSGGAFCLGKETVLQGRLGYNRADIQMANTYDFSWQCLDTIGGGGRSYLKNVKLQTTPTVTYRNDLRHRGQFCFEHYGQVANAHQIWDSFGDIIKIDADGNGAHPSQRSGGNATLLEFLGQSNCGPNAKVMILDPKKFQVWAAANASKTYRLYVQTNYTGADPVLTANEISLIAEYPNHATNPTYGTVTSTGTVNARANAADWSQYIEVTVQPLQDGWVRLELDIMAYEAAKNIWIDPQVEIL